MTLVPNPAPWASVPCCHHGLNWCVIIPGGFDPCCNTLGKGHNMRSTLMLTPQPCSWWQPKAAPALAQPQQSGQEAGKVPCSLTVPQAL